MSKGTIAVGRFGLGARPKDLSAIEEKPESWLLDQLQGPDRLADDISRLPSAAATLVELQKLRREQRESRTAEGRGVNLYGRAIRQHYLAQVLARYTVAATSDTPFHERLVHFWSNHFAVSADKQPLAAIAGLFENEVVRPNVSGKFVDLLLAAEKHPAMILYLDNQRSIGPRSKLASRAGRRRPETQFGLNENLAREILELHTLGVHGGYTQHDVTALAKVITGWSVGGNTDQGRFSDGTPGEFAFRETIHEPGSQRILNQRYSQKGLAQGEAVLRDLAIHPSTARFLATKLARHFVADEPPATLVDEMTDNFLDSGGELSAFYRSLVTYANGWDNNFSKYKSPHDFVISTFRAFDYAPTRPQFVFSALDLMGQAPFRPGSPAGWPDTAEAWGGADALYKRIEWSNVVADQIGSRVNPVQLGDAILGKAFLLQTRDAVSRAESLTQGLTLFLSSPNFQRR